MTYSPFFQVLYDEEEAVSDFGRGAHYSVLRVPVWQDAAGKPLRKAQLLDFAVIWDDDHDTRVFEAVESMYFEGLMGPVRYIGERKGGLTVLLDPNIEAMRTAGTMSRYAKLVNQISQGLEDPWPATVDMADSSAHSMIHAAATEVSIYLSHIQVLWKLGLRPYSQHLSASAMQRAEEQRWVQGLPFIPAADDEDIAF